MMLGNFDAARQDAAALVGSHFLQYRLYGAAAQFASGDFSGAAAEFAAYTQVLPDDPHGWLWLYLADRALGKDDTAKLKDLAQSGKTWPTPIIRYAAGEASAEAVAAAVEAHDATVQRLESAEAAFYMGEIALLGGDKAKAAQLFESCLKIGHAAVGSDNVVPLYKGDDDLELAMANAALRGKAP
jgi:lipoprotein NlpI